MKYMETINEMQAVMTKLRREVQRGEAPKKGKCIICGFKHPKIYPAFGVGVPKDVIDKLFKYPDLPETEGDDVFAKYKSCVAREAREKFEAGLKGTAGKCPCKSEDFPREDCSLHSWMVNVRRRQEEYQRIAEGQEAPDDLVAAMGVLFEYGEKTGWHVSVGKRQYGRPVWIKIGDMNYEFDESLPQAIYEAIVAHAEGK